MSTQRRPWPVRTLDDADWPAFTALDSHAFGNSAPAELLKIERAAQEPGRSIGATDGAELVGIATAYAFDLTVPGATVPAAGISWVGVLPTHRRRGVLSALMDHQLGALHEAGREPIAVLWASEPPIYGRYGYGLASRFWSLTVGRSATALDPAAPVDPDLTLRLVPADDWKRTAGVYDTLAVRRPGMFARNERWWKRAVIDLPDMREGRSELRCVVVEDDTGVRGYARYCDQAVLRRRLRAGQGRGARGDGARPRRPRHAVPLPVRPGPDGQHRDLERPGRRPAAALAAGPAAGEAGGRATPCTSGSSTWPPPSARGPTPPTSTSCST